MMTFLYAFRYWYLSKDGSKKEGSIDAENMYDAGDKIVEKHGKEFPSVGIVTAVWGFVDLCILWWFGVIFV